MTSMQPSTTTPHTQPRDTKYCQAIRAYIIQAGHATNAMILQALKQEFTAVTATTVHRATARLARRGQLSIAPTGPDGSMCYDANTAAHDHFMCHTCGRLRDINIAETVRPLIESQLKGCRISGRITISGTCTACSIQSHKKPGGIQ